MKVVLFCGGLGMRLREYSEAVPKPLVPVGGRPILWHLMKYYAYWGHRHFILCLGHRGDAIRHYLQGFQAGGTGEEVENWRIDCVDTGLSTPIGQRLKAVEHLLADEDTFLANYADGLTDLPLPDQVAHFTRLRAVAGFLSVRPNLSYHSVVTTSEGLVTSLHGLAESGVRVNGGFFVFRKAIFEYIRKDEDLVDRPFQRLIKAGKLAAFRYDGFWQAVDTMKDKAHVDELAAAGTPPWQVWVTRRNLRVV